MSLISPTPSLSGPALHTGVMSTVRAARRHDDGLGIRFHFPGFAAPLDARTLGTLRRSAHRATVLTHPESGATIRTPEHMLAAALFFADEPLDVFCDANEPPGLDGSAQPWFDFFAVLAPEAAGAPRCREYDSTLELDLAGRGNATLRATRAPRFSVECFLERGDFRDSFRLEASADAPGAVLPARTFIFWNDWNALSGSAPPQKQSLVGAGEESGLLLAEFPQEFAAARRLNPRLRGNAFPLLHPREFRMKAEAARHKILDMLGDLALNGLALPRIRLEIRNGGHALNHLLLERL